MWRRDCRAYTNTRKNKETKDYETQITYDYDGYGSCILIYRCGNKKADETTATTEAASEVKDEFIKFVGTDIPKMDTEEAEIMKKFNSYFAEGTAVDTDALLKDLTDNLLPNYKTFLDDVQL